MVLISFIIINLVSYLPGVKARPLLASQGIPITLLSALLLVDLRAFVNP